MKRLKRIQVLEGSLFYKYLGIDQEFNTKESFTWERVKDRCIVKFKKIWVLNLTFRQKVDTHNSAIKESTIYTWAYLCTRADLKSSYNLFEKMANRDKRSIISDAKRVLKDYNIDVEMEATIPAIILGRVRYVEATQLTRKVVELMRNINNNTRYAEWKDLKLVSRVLRSEQTIDLATSFEWLRKGRLSSNGIRNNTEQGKRCRKCRHAMETIEHVISCCKKWLTTLYIDRHILCRRFDVQPPHYTQQIISVIETDSIRLYWNHPVQTRTIIRHNKPDLIIFDNVKKTALIIEVTVSWFTGLEKQNQIKINRYSVNSQ
jgi:hypothetical protein